VEWCKIDWAYCLSSTKAISFFLVPPPLGMNYLAFISSSLESLLQRTAFDYQEIVKIELAC
jgi:hypothetical protein